MLKNILSLIICGVFFMISGISHARAQDNLQASSPSTMRLQNIGNKICPVTGNQISEDTNVTYEYEGKIYNFCCAGCIDEFKKDPIKYIKRIEKEKNSSLSITNK